MPDRDEKQRTDAEFWDRFEDLLTTAELRVLQGDSAFQVRNMVEIARDMGRREPRLP